MTRPDEIAALADESLAGILRGWAKAYRDNPQYRFPSDPGAEFFPVDLENAADALDRLSATSPGDAVREAWQTARKYVSSHADGGGAAAAIIAMEAALATAAKPGDGLILQWRDGAPPKPWCDEWFIAETTFRDRVVLTALPEEYSYDFKTADDTYIKADKIKRWMQFPDSQFIAPATPTPPSADVAGQIIAERQRQIAKGYDAAHDDEHTDGAIAMAAAAYAKEAARNSGFSRFSPRPLYPWSYDTFRDYSPREGLIVAASLCVAEIERIDRSLIQSAAPGCGAKSDGDTVNLPAVTRQRDGGVTCREWKSCPSDNTRETIPDFPCFYGSSSSNASAGERAGKSPAYLTPTPLNPSDPAQEPQAVAWRSPPAGLFVDPTQGLMIRFENNRYRKATLKERDIMLSALRGHPLPDSIRLPLHELQADVDYLIGRVVADGSCAQAISTSIKSKLHAVEQVLYTRPVSLDREALARIIDPDAWEDLDDLSPTEREMWDRRVVEKREYARSKADAILALIGGRA